MTRSTLPGVEHSDHCWDTFQRSAWRYECKQHYASDEASIAEFLKSGKRPPGARRSRWHNEVSGNIAAGKTMQRLKVVRRPFSDDVRYLLDVAIPGNVAAGEDYRILDVTDTDIDLPDQDFWMFDDDAVLHLNFETATGALLGFDLIENQDLTWYRDLRDRLVPLAVPFPEYVAG